jgi:hypothetical protein
MSSFTAHAPDRPNQTRLNSTRSCHAFLPPIPHLSRSRLRTLIGRIDSYTLWAFNAQPPLSRRDADDR